MWPCKRPHSSNNSSRGCMSNLSSGELGNRRDGSLLSSRESQMNPLHLRDKLRQIVASVNRQLADQFVGKRSATPPRKRFARNSATIVLKIGEINRRSL